MTYSAKRGWLAWTTGLAMVGCVSAATAAPAGAHVVPSQRPPAVSDAPGGIDELPHRKVTAGSPARGMPARPSTTASIRRTPAATKVTGTLTSLDGICPAGLRRSTTLYADGFEQGDLPEPTLTQGFSVASAGAAEGARYAHSALAPTTIPAPDKPYHALFFPVVTTSPATRTVMSFRVKGDYGTDTAYVAVNDGNGWIEPSPTWGTVTVDVTSAVGAASGDRPAGEMDVRILNYPETVTRSTTLDIDDVQIYQCTPPPATGVRGDFDGDGVSDLVSVDMAGSLWVSPGRRNGTFGTPLRIGGGWQTMTWIGSPGDLTGDRRPDIVARRFDGRLFLYAGHGMGSFARARQIGVGWNSLTAILTPGDTNGDRVAEMIGRDGAGRLFRWNFTAGGLALVSKTQIGFGFTIFTRMVAPGDINLDGRGDLLGIRPDGVTMAYHPDRIGRLGRAVVLSQGWQIFTAVTGPGDLNGDGRGDVVGRRGDGTLWTFLSLSARPTAIPAGSNANRFRLFA